MRQGGHQLSVAATAARAQVEAAQTLAARLAAVRPLGVHLPAVSAQQAGQLVCAGRGREDNT